MARVKLVPFNVDEHQGRIEAILAYPDQGSGSRVEIGTRSLTLDGTPEELDACICRECGGAEWVWIVARTFPEHIESIPYERVVCLRCVSLGPSWVAGVINFVEGVAVVYPDPIAHAFPEFKPPDDFQPELSPEQSWDETRAWHRAIRHWLDRQPRRKRKRKGIRLSAKRQREEEQNQTPAFDYMVSGGEDDDEKPEGSFGGGER